MKNSTLPQKGGSFLRAKDGTLAPNPDTQPATKGADAPTAKSGDVKPVKKEA